MQCIKMMCSGLMVWSLVVFSAITWAGEVVYSASDVNPIKVGETVPSKVLLDSSGKEQDISKLLATKPTVLIFYRGGWCPYCNTHLADLRKIEKELIGLGYQILAISPDLPQYLKDTQTKQKLSYTLLSDSKMELATALGLAFKLDDATFALYQQYNIDIEKNSGQKHRLLPVPAALVLDQKGVVSFIFSAPDYKVRVDTDVILAAAKAQIKQQK